MIHLIQLCYRDNTTYMIFKQQKDITNILELGAMVQV